MAQRDFSVAPQLGAVGRGIAVAREFQKTRELMEDRERRFQAEEQLQGLEQEITQAEAQQRIAQEEWAAFDEADEAGEPVSAADRAKVYRKVVISSIDALQKKMNIFSRYMGTGNEYIQDAIAPLLQNTVVAFQQISAGFADAAEYDVQARQEERLAREGEAGIEIDRANVRLREQEAATEAWQTRLAQQQFEQDRERYEARKPMQRLEDELSIAEFVSLADANGWGDDQIAEIAPGVDPNRYRDPDRYLSKEAQAKVADIKQYRRDLMDRAEEGEDVSKELAQANEDLADARQEEGLYRAMQRNRERALKDKNIAERLLIGAKEKVRGLYDEFGFAWLGPAGVVAEGARAAYNVATSDEEIPPAATRANVQAELERRR